MLKISLVVISYLHIQLFIKAIVMEHLICASSLLGTMVIIITRQI